jgi:hypothetical protein
VYSNAILSTPIDLPAPHRSGRSSEGRPIPAYRFGGGKINISLIAGCHADEPTGPRLLRKLGTYLSQQKPDHPLLARYAWWIVPHANPDGEAVNRRWYDDDDEVYDLPRYLRYAERALPREDIEFGFPIPGEAGPKRPENKFIFDFWRSAGRPFHLHASLHSMAIAFGAWFLIDGRWVGRSAAIQQRCLAAVDDLGYPPHDVDRKGEKGFIRIAEGFATRPNHRAMRQYFLEREDKVMASYFHPSSMESIRSLGGDCLTLVSEMPLFLIPRKEKDLSWPNPAYDAWKRRLEEWKAQLLLGKMSDKAVIEAARRQGLQPMPVADQMQLQWAFVCAGFGVH